MNWFWAAGIVLGIIITAGIFAKLILHRRLAEIDGLSGVRTVNLTDKVGTVIGSFGDDI